MFYVGLDIHSTRISVCALNGTGQVVHRSQVRTIQEMVRVLKDLPDLTSTTWRALLDREREHRLRMFETFPTGGKQHRVAVREWWGTVSEVLKDIQNVTDWDVCPTSYSTCWLG
jgi:hypothetical protein